MSTPLKQQLLQQLNQLETERSSFEPHWRELSDFTRPRSTRFTASDVNRGDRRNSKIIDPTASLASSVLSSGMMSGITSPARPWFRLATPDPDLMDYGPVKLWLETTEQRMNEVFNRSNLYQSLPLMYGDLGTFGTAAMAVVEDSQRIIRTVHFPLGSYYIANSPSLSVDVCYRKFTMTVRQLVMEFGIDSVSDTVKSMWNSSQYSQWVEVVHAVYPNIERQTGKLEAKHKPFKSVYLEVAGDNEKVLRESGYDEFPIMAPRWEVNGEDVYGSSCPGMLALTRHDRIRQSALNRMTPLEREELDAAADDIVNKIIGAPSGIVPSELIPDGLIKRAGFTKDRTLNIPDERIKDYLESDVNYVMENYIRQVAPEIELTAKFGRVDMDNQIKAITEEYNQLIADATTPKERSRLEARREADLRDIRAMHDRLLGTYGAPKDPSTFFVRAGRVARHVNFLRLLGGMTISSLPDMARPIMQHGLRSALKPLGKMLTDIGAMRIAKADLREMGISLEYVLSSRSKVIADLSDPYSRRSYLERGLQWSSQKFGNLTLMNQYTDTMKMWSGVITQSKVLRAANTLDAGGTLSKREIKKLAHIGIDESMLKRIADQFKRHGEDLDGMLTGHSHLWDDRVVRETFQAAVLKDVRTTVITPGIGDTPLMMSSELGKIVMQFKTFFFATHNRALVSGIQSGDASFYYGALLQVALGSLVYVLKAKMAGRDINTEPANLVKEGLDWSGMMGWLGEPNNILENLSGGTYGMSAMFGGPPASRYQSRNGIGALLGPTFDLGGDIKNITSGVLNGEFDDREVRSVRKLLPFQNLFYLSPLLNQVEEQMK